MEQPVDLNRPADRYGAPHKRLSRRTAVALIVGALYMLRAVRKMLYGPLPERWQTVTDAPNLWRKLPFALLLASLLVFGFFPSLLTDKIQPDVRARVLRTEPATAPLVASSALSQNR